MQQAKGHELDGMNLVGTAVQLGVAAVAIGRALLDNADDEDARALKELQAKVEAQSARLDPLGQKLEDKITEVAQTQTETKQPTPEPEAKTEETRAKAETRS